MEKVISFLEQNVLMMKLISVTDTNHPLKEKAISDLPEFEQALSILKHNSFISHLLHEDHEIEFMANENADKWAKLDYDRANLYDYFIMGAKAIRDDIKVRAKSYVEINAAYYDLLKERQQSLSGKLSWAAYMAHNLLSGIDLRLTVEEKTKLIKQAQEYELYAAKILIKNE